MSFFPTRYPIMCAVMNGVSGLDLALVVESAGAMPSLWLNVRDDRFDLDLADINRIMDAYRTKTGHTNLVLAVHHKDIVEPEFFEWLLRSRPSHMELIGYEFDNSRYMNDPRWPILMNKLRKSTKVMIRIISPMVPPAWADAVCIKGRESAGCTGMFRVKDLMTEQMKLSPHVPLIPYGGVGTAEQVKEYIEQGAAGVACGTVFAASAESPLSPAVKLKIVQSTVDDLFTFPDTKQRALLLGSERSVLDDTSDWNRDHSLYTGIKGDGKTGHIYMGESIQYVSSVRSVKEIVDDLAHLL